MSTSDLSFARVAAAVVVASGLCARARELQGTSAALRLVKLAADVIDRTQPSPVLAVAYRDRPAGMLDDEFLAGQLSSLEPLAPAAWPRPKVWATQWGEFTRVLKGLNALFGSKEDSKPLDSEKNLSALRAFVDRHIGVLAALDQIRLRAALDVAHG
jgi:hypothetical protein